MTCRKCRHEFCWVCMGKLHVCLCLVQCILNASSIGPWSEHGTSWYNCNRFDEKSSAEARENQTQSRVTLERYLHVCVYPLCVTIVLIVMCCLLLVLQPLCQSRTISKTWPGFVFQDWKEDGRNATNEWSFMDWSAVLEEGSGCYSTKSYDAQVDLCICILSLTH